MKKDYLMKSTVMIFCLLIISVKTFTQDLSHQKVYNQIKDTAFADIVKWSVNHEIDSTVFGTIMPTFLATDLNNSIFRRDTLKSIVFYNFWFTTCSPCVAEIPIFDSLQKKYSNKVDFIAITFEEKGIIKDFLKIVKFISFFNSDFR